MLEDDLETEYESTEVLGRIAIYRGHRELPSSADSFRAMYPLLCTHMMAFESQCQIVRGREAFQRDDGVETNVGERADAEILSACLIARG